MIIRPTDVSHEQAFRDYCAMEKPDYRVLAAHYKETFALPPAAGTMQTWYTRHKWRERLADLRTAKVEDEQRAKEFIAKTALRDMARQILHTLSPVSKGIIDPAAQKLIENSAAIQRLVRCTIECLDVSEKLEKSSAEKEAEETNKTAGEHTDDTDDFVRKALMTTSSQVKKTQDTSGVIPPAPKTIQ